MELCNFCPKNEFKKNSHCIFWVWCLSRCVSGWCQACRRLSLMEANVDTSHPRCCRQLTGCLIKVIHCFIWKCWQNVPMLHQRHHQVCAVFTQEPDGDDLDPFLSALLSRQGGSLNNHHRTQPQTVHRIWGRIFQTCELDLKNKHSFYTSLRILSSHLW